MEAKRRLLVPLLVVALALSLGLLLAGCGGGTTITTTEAATSTTVAVTTTSGGTVTTIGPNCSRANLRMPSSSSCPLTWRMPARASLPASFCVKSSASRTNV